MDRATLKENAKSQIKGNIGTLFLVSLLVSLVTYAAQLVPVVGSVASLIVGPVLAVATIVIYLNMADGIQPDIKELFNHFDKLLIAFKVNILTAVFTFLWSLLLFIPGIIKRYAYSQAMYIIAENPNLGGREALKLSEEMMKGHKMELFVLELSFLGWHLLGAMTFFIGYIWIAPYINATMANYYNYVKTTV